MTNVEYRGNVRSNDPATSWEAASLQNKTKVDIVKSVIMGLLANHGRMTDERLVDHFEAYVFMNPQVPHVTPQSIRTRRKHLVLEGLVKSSDERGKTRLGNSATLWEIA